MQHLDTSTVVAYLRGHRQVAENLDNCLPDVAISAVVLAELLYGARVSLRPEENIEHLRRFATLVEVVSFDHTCAEAYSHLRAALRRLGRPAGKTDMLTAAAALAQDATLVTHNTRHFEAIPGLRVVDWIA